MVGVASGRQYLMTGQRLTVLNRYEIDELELERLREAARVRAVSVHYGIDPHHGHLRHHGQHGAKSNGRASGTTRVSQVHFFVAFPLNHSILLLVSVLIY